MKRFWSLNRIDFYQKVLSKKTLYKCKWQISMFNSLIEKLIVFFLQPNWTKANHTVQTSSTVDASKFNIFTRINIKLKPDHIRLLSLLKTHRVNMSITMICRWNLFSSFSCWFWKISNRHFCTSLLLTHLGAKYEYWYHQEYFLLMLCSPRNSKIAYMKLTTLSKRLPFYVTLKALTLHHTRVPRFRFSALIVVLSFIGFLFNDWNYWKKA